MSIQKIFATLGKGGRLNGHERAELERWAGRMEHIDRTIGGWQAPSSPAPYFEEISWRKANAEFLPHEAAMLYAPTGPSLEPNTWVDVTTFDDPYTIAPDSTASHTWGMRVDAANGYIYVDNVPKESLLMVMAWATFSGDGNNPAVGDRQIKWIADDSSEKFKAERPADTTGCWDSYIEITHFRPAPSTHTWYKLQLGHTSTTDPLSTHSIGFVVVRLT